VTLIQSARPLVAWRWLGLPALYCVLATILFAVPIQILGLSLPEPVFPVILSFAWAVIRPSILAPFALLGIGLFLDLFWGGPAGLWAVSLLAPYAVVMSARSIMSGQSNLQRLAWYLAAVALTFASGYLLTAVDSGAFANPVAVFWQFFATALLYPFARGLIERFEDADVRFR
jgi:rod shape-determining protein MreD